MDLAKNMTCTTVKLESIQSILDSIKEAVAIDCSGKIATYIPQLGSVDPSKFGIHLTTVDGDEFGAGSVPKIVRS
ncbi:glutaminase [Mariniblastus sp.]|nr:glutaminase [Mariniblastus sp.]